MSNIREKVFCARCRRKTNHSIIEKNSIELKFVDEKHNNDQKYENSYYIVRCNGCDNISFVKESGYESTENEGRIWKYLYHVYPDPMERLDKIDNVSYKNLPEDIFFLLNEVHFAYTCQIEMLTVAGLRMLVEAICKDKGIVENNLYHKIESLKTTGIISESQRSVLQEIRLLGNETVQEIISHSDVLIKEGISVINSILNNIYGIDGFKHIDN